jgi:hypothetical protein
MPALRIIKGISMEQDRLFADPAQIGLHYATLAAVITGNPAALVINLDETGHQAWADAHKEFVIGPARFPGKTVSIPVDRGEKKAPLLAAIGQKLKSLVIIPRVTVEMELMHLGYGEECLLQYQENVFFMAELFDYRCEKALFPYIHTTRTKRGSPGEAVVLRDGCACYLTDYFLDECTFRGFILVFLPPHSSDQIQPLDLGIFHIQKAEALKVPPDPGLNPQTKQIIKAVNGYHRACCRTCVIGAFRRAEIVVEYDPTHSALVARVDRMQASNIRHWNLDKTRIRVDTLGSADK